MKLRPVLDAFGRAPAAVDLADRLPARGGGAPARRAARLERRGAGGLARGALSPAPAHVVAPTPADAERWLTDLAHLTDEGVALYPQREALGEDEPHYEIAGERAETIEALLQGRLRVLVTTARATAERTLVPAALERLRLAAGAGRAPPAGATWRSARADGLPAGADGHRGRRVQRARRHPRRVRLRHGGAGAAGVVGRRRLVAPRVRPDDAALAAGAERGHRAADHDGGRAGGGGRRRRATRPSG